VLLITAIFIYKNLRSQKKANHIIAAQKDEVELQKNIVEEKNTEITDSIRYAKRIQNAILTSDVYIKKHLNDYFILYKPKDIVSGDFYWTLMHNNKFFIVTADCTGHGVPGAMMSMLGINLLNQIVAEKNILDADAILNNLRREIIKAINPEDSQEESKDGMDCSLLIIDLEKMNLDYACANNAFYLVRNNSLIKYDADRMPVGKSPKDTIPFQKHSIQLQKNDLLITTTDGFTDQFGGAAGKKLKAKKLEQLILENHNRSLPDIKNALNTAFIGWKGDLEQVDDVTVIGIRI
jgi:serine phosphatase RsbU (regulator of sigma subunit)